MLGDARFSKYFYFQYILESIQPVRKCVQADVEVSHDGGSSHLEWEVWWRSS